MNRALAALVLLASASGARAQTAVCAGIYCPDGRPIATKDCSDDNYRRLCGLSSGSGGGSNGGGASQPDPRSQMIQQLGTSLANANKAREDAAHAKNQQTMRDLGSQSQTRMSGEQAQVQQAAEDARNAEEQRRQNALNQMGGPADSGIAPMDFDDYHAREAAKRKALKSAANGKKQPGKKDSWCKLHIPLKPMASVQQVEGADEQRMAIYENEKSEWDARCAGNGK